MNEKLHIEILAKNTDLSIRNIYLDIIQGKRCSSYNLSTESHSLFKGYITGYIFKEYKEWEKNRVWKSYLIGNFSKDLVMQAKGVIRYERHYYLLSKLIKKDSSFKSKDLTKKLTQFHKEVNAKYFTFIENFSKNDNFKLEHIDFLIEFERRVYKTRKTDKYTRLDGISESASNTLRKSYETIPWINSKNYVIHGDAHIGNIVYGKFVDFDHVRLGPLEYDLARLLIHSTMCSPEEVIHKNIDLNIYDYQHFVFNWYHQALTLAARSLARGEKDLSKNYLDHALAASNKLKFKEATEAINFLIRKLLYNY